MAVKSHMSEGVAVSFKDKFRKPTESDPCDRWITFQQNNNGAKVYSLITKPKFFKKPELKVYNMAFN